ncbi:hypothetical protein [Mycobacterium tilburgii]|uniref:hypothetical protein n=1 Tax=Mycobacterium tilburgii TaxID=44467 RepID=UPI0011820AD1|nr:hypothetical protein [Mycobacterium tilburgii]
MRLHSAANTLAAGLAVTMTCSGLTACGDDNNHHGAATVNPGTVTCDGKAELTAEGATGLQ